MTDSILQLAKEAGKVAESKKAKDIVILDLRGISTITDSFVICTVTSVPHAKAVAQAIQEYFYKRGLKEDHLEGFTEGTWILMDYPDFIIHIFLKEVREYYDLEHLWGDAPGMDMTE